MKKRILSAILTVLLIAVTAPSCTTTDPWNEEAYFTDLFVYNGTAWVEINSSDMSYLPASALNLTDLGDTNITAPANGNVLTYNATSGRWNNAVSAAAGNGSTLWEVDGTETQLIIADDLDIQNQSLLNVLYVNGVGIVVLNATVEGHTTQLVGLTTNVTALQLLSHAQNTDSNLTALPTKNPPIDADKVIYRDSTAGDNLVTSTWTQIKAFFKTYFDTIYATAADLLGLETAITAVNATVNSHTTTIAGVYTNVTTLQGSSHTQGTDTTLGVLTDDVDFDGFMAVAMVCDQGATVPAGPTTGQWFLHTPTGRKVLMQYDGSNWIGIISVSTMTVYVDKTDGTDAIDKGGAVDAGAFKTVQYAINAIPGLVGGNVVVNINAESYAETVTINGKNFRGDYSITLAGTLTVHDNIVMDGNGVQGSLANQAAAYENGMTTDHYANQLFKFTSGSNNGLYRIIDTNSNDAGTRLIMLCGNSLNAQPVNLDTATIYTWGTTLLRVVINKGQKGVVLSQLAVLNTANSAIMISEGASVTITQCSVTITTTGNIYCVDITNAYLGISDSYFYDSYAGASETTALLTGAQASIVAVGIKVRGVDAGASYGIAAQRESFIQLSGCCVVVDWNWGILINKAGSCSLRAPVINVYNIIRSCPTYGVAAIQHGFAISTSCCVFVSCPTPTYAEAASYSVIVA